MELGERIKERRKQLMMTQKELGDKIQVTQKQISKYERNESIPSLNQIEKIADALNVSRNYFIYDAVTKNIHTGKIINKYTSPYTYKNEDTVSKPEDTANKPLERNFSKQQQELLEITDKMTDQQQTELLGAMKMFLIKNPQ